MIDVNDLRKGVTFEFDGQLYKVLDYHHNKTGRGNASIKIKARNMRTFATLEKTFNSGERVQDVRLDYHTVQYLYSDGSLYHFMDMETFEQPVLSGEVIGDSRKFLKEGVEIKLTLFENEPLDVELPTTVDLRVTRADSAVRGDTATGVTKRVTLETGAEVLTPSFVEENDVIRVDTRTGEYVTRI
ncbi:MAG TPA: elongation factor P [Candidatus Atribacteria bacterium]|nr:elongation factor P [Candidatus Atribacteria bacterium]